MRWQAPHTVTGVLEKGINYELDAGEERKQHRTYHIGLLSDINVLCKWRSRDATGALVMSESPVMSLSQETTS